MGKTAGLAKVGHIRDVTADPENRRAHNPRNIGMLADALQQVGAARSIVIDEDDVVLAGNGVLEAAAEVGITKLQVIEADGQTVIAVRRRGLTDEQKRRLAMFDNRVAELADWNVAQLQVDAASGLDLAPFFFDKELDKLLKSGGAGGAAVIDAVPSQFVVIVECASEAEQTDLLTRLTEEGKSCRAVMS